MFQIFFILQKNHSNPKKLPKSCTFKNIIKISSYLQMIWAKMILVYNKEKLNVFRRNFLASGIFWFVDIWRFEFIACKNLYYFTPLILLIIFHLLFSRQKVNTQDISVINKYKIQLCFWEIAWSASFLLCTRR